MVVEEHNSNDIITFVYDRLNLHYRTPDNTPDLERWHELRKDLVRRAHGIFQWVHLVIPMVEKYIDEGWSPEDVQQELQQVPEGLGDVYDSPCPPSAATSATCCS